jgi:hypothetical protein
MRRIAALAAGLAVTLPLLLLPAGGVAAGSPSASASAAPATADTPATKTETIARDETVDGKTTVTDTRTVSLTVSNTTNLAGRQEIAVSWTGAHPTGGIVADQNSIDAQSEEYPFVLMECRGIDSATAPASEQLTPDTCWTQGWSERFQDTLGDQYPPYRLDQYGSSADRAAIVGAPATLNSACRLALIGASVQHWVPFVAAGGQVYGGGPAGCAGEAPESDDAGGSGFPSNETFGVTDANGRGSANFTVWTSAENASLGCTQSVPCALVAVPIMGISCDLTSATPAPDATACTSAGQFQSGELMPAGGGGDLSVSGSLWWSASNWRNRITVPLSFSIPPGACGLVNTPGRNIIDVYGSELMIQATDQWEPQFCLKEPFSLIHVQTTEPAARSLLATDNVEAALTSFAPPDGYGRPVVNAPVAVTGFSVSYDIDGANGQPYPDLKLTPRLLAKLLTESYPGDLFLRQSYSALANNPLNITTDPEFQALNPGVAPNTSGSDEAAAELIALSSSSDVIQALTTYINDDPSARAWLNGTPDPWGMVVNPAYKGISLPVSQWPLLSTFEPSAWYQADANDCLLNDPVPYQPLVAAPLGTLENISQDMQYGQPNSTTVCVQPIPDSAVGEKLVANGRQPAGHRFMIGITPLADNQRYLISTAGLETANGTFVAPTDDSLRAATALLQPDTKTGTWDLPYNRLETSAAASAYPGTMVVYAAVPTSGLPKADAADLATFLQFAATTGQTSGFGIGQLPPGYLPLTAANGLSGLADYTVRAASDVAAQDGRLPPMTLTTTHLATPTSTTVVTAKSPVGGSAAAEPVAPAATPEGDVPAAETSGQVAGSNPARNVAAGKGRSVGDRPHKDSIVPTVFQAGRTLGRLLWTGGWLSVLIVGAGVAGAVLVPGALLFGRRRGLW